MTLTEKKAINIVKRLKCPELVESIQSYPDNERGDRNDFQFLADEISYFRSCYEEDGHVLYDDLEDARELLRATKNGNEIPLNPRTGKPKPGYWPSDIACARWRIEEYKQVKYYEKKLASMGYFGKW